MATKKTSLTDLEIAELRFKCIELVVSNGSRNSAIAPQKLAQEYFDFVIEKTASKKKAKPDLLPEQKVDTVIQVEPSPTPELKSEQSLEFNPFGDSGRPQVLIS